MPPAPTPRDRPFNLPRNPKYTEVRDVTGKTRSPARGFVTAAMALHINAQINPRTP